MKADERFRLNEGIKTHRLEKLRKRLNAATPSKRSAARINLVRSRRDYSRFLWFWAGLLACFLLLRLGIIRL